MKFSILYNLLFEAKKKKTLALVPGSYKPPHNGHLGMLKYYSKKADEVIVFISVPTAKSKRLTNLGKEITAEVSKEIMELLVKSEGLKNIKVEIAKHPSPVKAIYDFVEFELKKPEEYEIILGASKKGGDYKRWLSAPAYFIKKNIPVTIADVEKNAAPVVGDDMSAGNLRNAIDDKSKYSEFYPKKIIDKVYNILNNYKKDK